MVKQFKIKVNGNPYLVEVEEIGIPAPARQSGFNQATQPAVDAGCFHPRVVQGSITAPMPGVVTKLCCQPGDKVAVGQSILILEAMKMENDIAADTAGIVQEIRVEPGQSVAAGEILAVIA